MARRKAGKGRTPGGWRRWLRRLLIGGGALAAVGLAVWYLVIPYPWTLRTRNPERTALMEQRLEQARRAGDTLRIRHEWVPLEAISPRLQRAVVVAEDHRFREHDGIDWQALAEEVRWSGGEDFSWTRPADLAALGEALRYVWANRDSIRGRSTLTQQLAKNLYFGTDRSFLRKAMEFVVARRLERRLSKDRILELYLNLVEWGPGLFGAEAASRAYFGRSAGELTLGQAAALAGTLPHPLTSNPAHRPARMRWRQELILDRLTGPRAAEPAPIPRPEVWPPPADPEVEPPEPGAESVVPVGGEGGVVPEGGAPAPADTAAPTDPGPRPDTLAAPDTTGGGVGPR